MSLLVSSFLRFSFALIILLGWSSMSFAQSAAIGDPCLYFGGKPFGVAAYDGYGNLTCTEFDLPASRQSTYYAPHVQLLIALHNKISEQEATLVKLRQELVQNNEVLASAVAALDEATKKNAAWRIEVLAKNLDSITAVPIKLAENDSLRKALASALASDPVFLSEVKKSIK